MKTLFTIISMSFVVFFGSTQNTLIPDMNFEQALINQGYDIGPTDGIIPTANINSLTLLDVSFSNISDLTGIQDFVLLDTLICDGNQLSSIDVTQNIELKYLSSGLNQLSNLDLTQNPNLQFLGCAENQLTTLDVSQNVQLSNLNCSSNDISSLNLSQNPLLYVLACTNMTLLSLDVSQNSDLYILQCQNNMISDLDLSQNISLYLLACDSNQLECLNIKNGNNINMFELVTTDNPNLYCIEVDDPNWALANWTVAWGNIDAIVSFSNYCGNTCTTSIEEIANTKKKLIKIIDYLGRETIPSVNEPLLYLYGDGSVEKRFISNH